MSFELRELVRALINRLSVDSSGNIKVTQATALQGLIAGVETDSILALVGKRADAFQATATSANASVTPLEVKAKTSSKKIYVTDLIISVDTAMWVQMQDDAATVLMEQMYFPANSIFSKTFSTPIEVATNKDLEFLTSAAGNISVTAAGYVI